AIGTRELIRRFQIEGRTPRARLLRADVRAESGGDAGWLLVDYEQEGDGLSLQLFTETPADYALRTSIPFMPDRSIVHGAPAFDGAHAIRFDGEPAGPRVATLFFYDLGGVVAKLGPFSLDVSPGKKTEGAPTTVFQGETPFPEPGLLSVATNGLGGELSWRIVSPGSAPAWSEWSNAQTFPLPRLPRGTYELFVRSRHSDNAAAVRVEEADPLELGLRVDGSGRIEVRR
ncbi:hypothetical protein HY251_17840, partial [bacterium]|nr:hypothetical protein [bacterium]